MALGVRRDGQKVLLAIKSMGGESEAAIARRLRRASHDALWRALLDTLVARGLPAPELVIVDGAPGLDKALAALWPQAPVQRCTVRKGAVAICVGIGVRRSPAV